MSYKLYFCGMDAKITLSFDEAVIKKAKQYAETNNISLSRMIEFLLKKITSSHYHTMEDYPVADWVQQLAEGEAVYQTKGRSRKKVKEDFYKGKR
jgi:antitoxin component of RelBE/YafQ-DinJ toxin-antitoxin module